MTKIESDHELLISIDPISKITYVDRTSKNVSKISLN